MGAVLWFMGALALAAEPLTPAEILERLQSRQDPVRCLGVTQVRWGQGHDAAYQQALADLIDVDTRRTTPESAFLALEKLGSCPLDDASATLAGRLKSRDWRLAMFAADWLGRRQAHETADALRACWDRPDVREHYALRHAVIGSLGNLGSPAAVKHLVDLLPQLDGQLQYEAVARLTVRTGQTCGDDAAAWSDWWDSTGNQQPIAQIDPTETLPLDLGWSRPLPKFFGQPIYAQRVVFVLDRSQNMLSTLNGKTRLETMQDEFTGALKQFPEHVEFGLIVFHDRVERWRPALVPATSANKAAAIQALYALHASGRGAIAAPIEAALQMDPEVEKVIVLTAGKPASLRIPDPINLVKALTLANLFTRTRIDTFGINADGPPEQFLTALSQRNHGRYTRVR